jgi:hypothetical protein
VGTKRTSTGVDALDHMSHPYGPRLRQYNQIIQLRGTGMETRDFWEKFESVSKSLSIGLIPLVLGVAGYFVNGNLEAQKSVLERQKLDQQVFEEATKVIFSGEEKLPENTPLEARRLYRAHWIKTYNEYARKYAAIGISDDLVAAVMEREARPTAITAASDNSKSTTVSTSVSDGPQGWVAVGLFRTERQQDLNFDVVAPKGREGLENGMVILARWSVPIRLTTAYPAANPEIGRLEGGQCAKVVNFNNQVRGQAWAEIQVVQCPSEEAANRVAQVR